MSEVAPAEAGSEAAVWQEAVRSGQCPVCFVLRREEFADASHWVGGGVDDGANPRRLDEAGGFCNRHFWLLTKLHSPQSGAAMNDYIAGKVLERLRAPGLERSNAPVGRPQEAAGSCPVCARLRAFESAHVRELVEWLREDAAWAQYVGSRGLCLPHLLYCRALAEDISLRERLIAAQVAQIERLQAEMRGLIRKLGDGQRWTATHDEWEAYKRAMEKFVGRSGLL